MNSKIIIDSTPREEESPYYKHWQHSVDTTFLPKWGGYSDEVRKGWVETVIVPKCHYRLQRCNSTVSNGLVANGCKHEELT